MPNFINGSRFRIFEVSIFIECTFLEEKSNFVPTVQKVSISNMFLIFGGTSRKSCHRVALKAEIM